MSLYNQINVAISSRSLFYQDFALRLSLWILTALILACSNTCINVVVTHSKVSAVMSVSWSIIIAMF